MNATDAQFREAFETRAIAADAFRHRDHIRLAWIYTGRLDAEDAVVRAGAAIRAFAVHHNAAGKYHETITCAWVRLVSAARRLTPGIDDFDTFVGQHPYLLDKTLLKRFYSAELLTSERARARWVDPDLAALP